MGLGLVGGRTKLLERLVGNEVGQTGAILERTVGGQRPLIALDDGIYVGFDEKTDRDASDRVLRSIRIPSGVCALPNVDVLLLALVTVAAIVVKEKRADDHDFSVMFGIKIQNYTIKVCIVSGLCVEYKDAIAERGFLLVFMNVYESQLVWKNALT